MCPVDLQKLIDSTMMKGVSVWVDYPKIPGFRVEIAYVSKQHMIKITESCTKHIYDEEERKFKDDLDRGKVARHWAEKVVISWEGLTVKGFQTLYPIDAKPEDMDKIVEPTFENRVTIIWESEKFENWCLAVATSPSYFVDARKTKEKEVEQLEKQ